MATRPWVTIVFLCIGLDFHSVLFYLFIYLFYSTENWTQDLKFDRQVLYLWAPFLVLTLDFFKNKDKTALYAYTVLSYCSSVCLNAAILPVTMIMD